VGRSSCEEARLSDLASKTGHLESKLEFLENGFVSLSSNVSSRIGEEFSKRNLDATTKEISSLSLRLNQYHAAFCTSGKDIN